MKEKFMALILLVTVVSGTVSAYAAVTTTDTSGGTTYTTTTTTFTLAPKGSIRVSLRSMGEGAALWWPKEPQVYDGSFSVLLYTGPLSSPSDASGGAIYIGPLSIPLGSFSSSSPPSSSFPASKWITFWTYHYNDAGAQPYVNIVLDNGRTMEGFGSTTVVSGATIHSQTGQGYPSADLWIQMKPTDAWYTSYTSDPLLISKHLVNCGSGNCTMATWQAAFPTAKVVQIQIFYGVWTNVNQVIFIDDVSIRGMAIAIEPEEIATGTASFSFP
jgi:hypothetical protein